MKAKYKNIQYGAHFRQCLDFYTPKLFSSSTHVFFIIHGGAWVAGSKNTIKSLAEFLSNKGHFVANINYRWLQQVDQLQDQIQDIVFAYHFIFDLLIKEQTIDQVFVIGESAGAHLSFLSFPALQWDGIISISGPMLPEISVSNPLPFQVKQWFYRYLLKKSSGNSILRGGNISPFTFPIKCPVLLFQGKKDLIVNYRETKAFVKHLKEHNNKVKLILIPKWGHIYRVLHPRSQQLVYQQILHWIYQIEKYPKN